MSILFIYNLILEKPTAETNAIKNEPTEKEDIELKQNTSILQGETC